MRKLILFFFVLFYIGLFDTLNAQPYKSSLTGSVVKPEESLEISPTLTLEDFRFEPSSQSSASFIEIPRRNPGAAFLASGIIPGSGQAINGKWGRAAVYFLTDLASVAYYINQNNTAKRNERAYERYANQNWSVVAYAQWLVDYSEANGLSNGYEALASQVTGLEPDFSNTTNDWNKINISAIREVEKQTPFIYANGSQASFFSHEVQDYGSQQYYELMSKYYQFQPGWQDFHQERISNPDHIYLYTWDNNMITSDFIEGRDRAEEFNNNYRNAGNIIKLVMVNHVVSAFDAFFTVKLKNSRLEPSANLLRPDSFSLTLHF